MSSEARIAALNEHKPPFIQLLNGSVIAADVDSKTCIFEFHPTKDHCHSIDIVQGGFITVMLDAAMSHAVFKSCRIHRRKLVAVFTPNIGTVVYSNGHHFSPVQLGPDGRNHTGADRVVIFLTFR